MPRQQVRFESPDLGMRLDIPPTQLPANALKDSQNMVLRQGRFQPRYGVVSPGNAVGEKIVGVIPLGLTYKVSASFGSDFVLGCGQSTWWYWTSGPNWVGLGGTALSASKHAIFRAFAKNNATYILGCNSGVNVPQKWLAGVGNPLADLGGSPPKAKAMMVLANRVLLFNLAANTGYTGVVSPVGYDVSAFNDFDSGWSTTLNGLLVDTPGEVVGALEMGDLQGAIYKSDAIVMAVAQGGVNPFHFEWRSFGNVGPANERCIMAISDGSHIFLGSDGGVYRFDGVNVRALDEGTGHIKRAILKRSDPDLNNLTDKAWGFFDRGRNEVIFFFKGGALGTTTGVTQSVLINMNNLSVWPQTYELDSGSDATAGSVVNFSGDTRPRATIFKGATGKFFTEADNTMIDDVGAYVATWQTGYSDFGAPGVFKTLTESDHLFAEAYALDPNYVSAVGSQDIVLTPIGIDDGGQDALIGAAQTLTISNALGAQKIIDHRSTALMFGMQYVCAPTKLFEWRGSVLRAQTRGER